VQNPKDFAEERLRSSTPQGEGKKRSLLREREKGSFSEIYSPLYISFAPQYHIRATAARSAGIQKGRSPFAHGGVRGTMGRSPCALFAVCGETNGVYLAVVSLSFVQRREKETFAYNTEHSSDRNTTSSVTILIKVQNPKDFAEERLRSSTPQGECNAAGRSLRTREKYFSKNT